VKRTTELPPAIEVLSRPFHGLRRKSLVFPAMNRWATVIRPLRGLKPKRLFVRSLVVACLLAAVSVAHGATCSRVKSQPDAWVASRVDALVVAARRAYHSDRAIPAYSRVLDGITKTIKRCKLSEDAYFITRYRTFVDYVEIAALDRDPDHELGFNVSDERYFKETRQFVQIPEFLLDQAFLQSVSRSETLDRAKTFLRNLNARRDASDQLIFFSYESQHLGTPDNDKSFLRLLIVVPGDAAKRVPEKWVQFGVPDRGARLPVRNLSVVAAVPGANGTFNAYFKDFFRTYERNGKIKIDGRWELGEGDDNCAQCHKSGILPIFPVEGSVSAAETQALLTVNERFRTYGVPRFGGYLDQRKLGPGLSSASLDSRKRRFGPRFEESPAAGAMVCSSCHNSERLGSFNWPMDEVLISSYVEGGQMPLGHKLKTRERRDLYAKLVTEYFAVDADNPGILKSWLLRQSAMTP
jgi:hypothetical protein